MTVTEAASLIGVTRQAVLDMIRRGEIKNARQVSSPNAKGFVWDIPTAAVERVAKTPLTKGRKRGYKVKIG